MSPVPVTVDGVTAAWLATQVGPIDLVEVSRIGAAHGFVSTVARVRGRHASGPLDLVVKLTAAERASREAWFLRLAEADGLLPGLPRCHAVVIDDEEDRGAVVMDHVDGVQGDVRIAIDHAVVALLLDDLATLHQRFDGGTAPVLDPVRAQARPRFLVRRERLDTLLDRPAAPIDDDTRAGLEWLVGEAEAAQAHLDDGPVTLVHGDVHLDNVLVTDDGPVLLDWEGVRLGTPAEDVARLVAARTTGGPSRSDRVAAVSRAYADRVRRRGGEVDPQLRARVRSALVALAAGMVNWAGRVALEPSSDPRRRAVEEGVVDEIREILAMVR